MGYETDFSLTLDGCEYQQKLFWDWLEEQIDKAPGRMNTEDEEEIAYAIDISGGCNESCRWYYHEEDMKRISKMFPKVIFHLRGIGEENDDIWEEHFKDGKMQHCDAQTVFPPFDEKKLK